MANSIKATVFIPVYNGENDHLEETLTAVFNQKTDFEWDVLVYDSESRDNSVEIIKNFQKKHKNLTFVPYEKAKYSHGRTRQEAAERSKGEIMVYLSQDAVPANENWLSEMVAPFEISDNIKAVLGRQIPRRGCFPAMKYDIEAVFDEQGVNDAVTIWGNRDEFFKGKYTKESFYSDVCSAAPREFLVNEIGYRDVAYSEDYEYGKDIIDAGYLKAYNAKAIVEHSNDIELKNYRKRIFDESFNVRKNSGTTNPLSMAKVIFYTIRGANKDFWKIIRDNDFSKKRKLYWIFVNPLFHFEKWMGVRLANSVELDGDNDKFSLERSE